MTALLILAPMALWVFLHCNRNASAMLYHRKDHDDE